MKEQFLPEEKISSEWEQELSSAFQDIEYKKGDEAKKQRLDFLDQDKKLTERTKDAEILYRYLRRFAGIEPDIKEIEYGVFELSHKNILKNIPDLPKGYGYKGGVARAYLESALGLRPAPVRDLDLIFLGDCEDENDELSNELAKKYMPNDYENGYGVECIGDDYFNTRDFTLNEVYVDGTKNIRATRQCILDTVRRVLRLAEYEKREDFSGEREYWVKWKILAKALRFMAQEKARRGNSMKFADIEAVEWFGIDSFNKALHLDHAMELGVDVAINYVEELISENQLPPDIDTPDAAAEYLQKDLSDFVFKAPRLQGTDSGLTGEDEREFWEKDFEDLINLPSFESLSKPSQSR